MIWSLIRAMLGLLRAGLVKILAADPKVMELAYGRAIFDTCGELRRSSLPRSSPCSKPR